MILIRHRYTSSCGHGFIRRFWEQREGFAANWIQADTAQWQTLVTNDSRLRIQRRQLGDKNTGSDRKYHDSLTRTSRRIDPP
ncbi:hypothetical protein METHPM2_70064 [Pseudomonas sp. PM2]